MTLTITRVTLGSVEAEGVESDVAAEAVALGSVEAGGAEAEAVQEVEVAAEGVAAAVVTTVVTTVMVKVAAAAGAVEAKEAVQGSVPLQQEVRLRPLYLEVAVEHRSLYPTDNHSQVALQAEEHED